MTNTEKTCIFRVDFKNKRVEIRPPYQPTAIEDQERTDPDIRVRAYASSASVSGESSWGDYDSKK